MKFPLTNQNFFMAILRTWAGVELQASPDQTLQQAEPIATDGRFKAAAFFLFLAWCVIIFSLRHSIKWYRPRNRGMCNRFLGFFRYTPSKFMLVIPLALVIIGYEAATAFDFTINPMSINAGSGWIFGLGYGPPLLILFIFNVYGYIDENEDQVLLQQRRERGEAIDQELGIVKKPRWWDSFRRDFHTSEQRLRNMTTEVGGGQATHQNITIQRDIEMGIMPIPSGVLSEPTAAATTNPFADEVQMGGATTVTSPPAYSSHAGPAEGSLGRSSTRDDAPPMKVRSMLDV
jgi:hypothetical protein